MESKKLENDLIESKKTQENSQKEFEIVLNHFKKSLNTNFNLYEFIVVHLDANILNELNNKIKQFTVREKAGILTSLMPRKRWNLIKEKAVEIISSLKDDPNPFVANLCKMLSNDVLDFTPLINNKMLFEHKRKFNIHVKQSLYVSSRIKRPMVPLLKMKRLEKSPIVDVQTSSTSINLVSTSNNTSASISIPPINTNVPPMHSANSSNTPKRPFVFSKGIPKGLKKNNKIQMMDEKEFESIAKKEIDLIKEKDHLEEEKRLKKIELENEKKAKKLEKDRLSELRKKRKSLDSETKTTTAKKLKSPTPTTAAPPSCTSVETDLFDQANSLSETDKQTINEFLLGQYGNCD